MGVAWFLDTASTGTVNRWAHSGGMPGTVAYLARLPSGVIIAIVSNTDRGGFLQEAIDRLTIAIEERLGLAGRRSVCEFLTLLPSSLQQIAKQRATLNTSAAWSGPRLAAIDRPGEVPLFGQQSSYLVSFATICSKLIPAEADMTNEVTVRNFDVRKDDFATTRISESTLSTDLAAG